MKRRVLTAGGWGWVVGISLTLAAIVLHLTGQTAPFELHGFDYHVRHFSRIPASDRIVHIDIDDDALERVASWPWSRDIQGDLISILGELGAEQVVVDIVWTEPRGAEIRHPTLDPYAELEGRIKVVGELSAANVVYPDDALAASIGSSGNVYLAMYYAQRSGPPERAEDLKRLAEELRTDFSLDADALSAKLGWDRARVVHGLAGVKRRVAQELVARELAERPDATAREVHQTILDEPFERQTADRTDLLVAYQRELGLRVLREQCPAVPPGLEGRLPVIEDVIPPVYKFSAGARGVGFVTFAPDEDGRTRHIPLMLQWEDRVIEQLAFRAMRDTLGIALDELEIDDEGFLRIPARADRPALRIQLDDKGQMLINWHASPDLHWSHCFTHVPVTRLLQIRDARLRARENEIRRQNALARAIQLVSAEDGYAHYRDQYNAMLAAQRAARLGELQGRGEAEDVRTARNEARRLRELVEQQQAAAFELIDLGWADLQAEPDPDDPEIAADYRRFQQAHRLVHEDAAALEEVNVEIAAEERRLRETLQPIVSGRVCFIGYTATAVADMIDTPAYKRMPGVLVHSNVFNDFLQGQFRTWSGPGLQVLAIAALGVLATVLAMTRGPAVSIALVVAVMAAALALNAWWVFESADHWLRLLTGLTVTFVIWAIIVLLRYLTTERQKRHLRKAVSQYVSPAMARRIGESAEQLDLSPVGADVTCFFSDLQGFTTISEGLGPEGTKTVLNPYLEAMSKALHNHQALINKFMGDGIFAFFNPPILPCRSHALAACNAALESQQYLRYLIKQHANHPLARDFERLVMRIGIATGHVFVGDYGSENKLDYTCVGDTVNLAARLESANKQFGTRVMLAGATYDQVADHFHCRRLGLLQVKGQTVGVPVHELLGRAGEVPADVNEYARRFGEAVDAFARRQWDAAERLLRECSASRSDDQAAQRYLRVIAAYRVSPPPEAWSGALELTEK